MENLRKEHKKECASRTLNSTPLPPPLPVRFFVPFFCVYLPHAHTFSFRVSQRFVHAQLTFCVCMWVFLFYILCLVVAFLSLPPPPFSPPTFSPRTLRCDGNDDDVFRAECSYILIFDIVGCLVSELYVRRIFFVSFASSFTFLNFSSAPLFGFNFRFTAFRASWQMKSNEDGKQKHTPHRIHRIPGTRLVFSIFFAIMHIELSSCLCVCEIMMWPWTRENERASMFLPRFLCAFCRRAHFMWKEKKRAKEKSEEFPGGQKKEKWKTRKTKREQWKTFKMDSENRFHFPWLNKGKSNRRNTRAGGWRGLCKKRRILN